MDVRISGSNGLHVTPIIWIRTQEVAKRPGPRVGAPGPLYFPSYRYDSPVTQLLLRGSASACPSRGEETRNRESVTPAEIWWSQREKA